jgi:hypothetical protein
MFMANSQKIKGAALKPLLFFISICMLVSLKTSYAQKISRYYVSSIQSNGTIYFVVPQKGFKNNDMNCNLVYDLTYLSSGDTVLFNFSYFDKSQRQIDSISFCFDNSKCTSKTGKIFVETKGNMWHYRYTSKISFKDLNTFYNQQSQPKLLLYTQQGEIKLNMTKSRWKTQATRIQKILTLIAYNKK